MRSALLELNGVRRVQVRLDRGETVVVYDERLTTPQALIETLNAAPGPITPFQYRAAVKVAPHPAPSAP